MKHTPGPWRYLEGHRGFVIEADCYDVAVVRDIGNHNNVANAALIASAPELIDFISEIAKSKWDIPLWVKEKAQELCNKVSTA